MREKLKLLFQDQETIDKVEAILREELSDKYVPKARFDEVNDAKKKAEADVMERDSQLESLKNSTGDMDKLKKQIEALQMDNLKAKQEYDASIKVMRRDDFVKTTLMEAGLLDTKYIPGVSAYLPIGDLDVDSVSSVESFKAKLAEAKTIAPSWFKSTEPPTKELGGLKINDPDNKVAAGQEGIDKNSYDYFLSQVNF